MQTFNKFSLAILLLCLSAPLLHAQLIVAPTSVFVDKSQPIATVILANQTSETREVSLELRFAYPELDSNGKMFMNYEASADRMQYSLVDFTKIFPRRMTLAPGERQNIRVMVRPGADLPAGAYWGRLMVISRADVEISSDENAQVGAQLNFSVSQVVPILFTFDAPTPQIVLGDQAFSFEDDKVILSHALQCTQNPPFYGSATCKVMNAQGEEVQSIKAPAAVFFESVKQFAFDRSQLPPGRYSVDFELSPDREGLDQRFLIDMDALSASWSFELTAQSGSAD